MMKRSNRRAKALTAISLVGALAGGVAAAGPAAAAAPQARSSASVSSTALVVGPTAATSPSSAPATLYQVVRADKGGAAAPQAINFGVRLAVKAALQTMRVVAREQYEKLMRQVSRGKTAFVKWYEGPNGAKVRNVLAGLGISVSGAALYDAIRWIIGI